MAEVLHLLPHPADYPTQASVAQLTRGRASTTLSIGRGGDLPNPWIGVVRLRQRAVQPDLIHAWGMEALTAAALSSNRPIVFTPTRYPNFSDLRWLRATMSVRQIEIICDSDTLRRGFVQRGVPSERCHLIRAGVDFSLLNRPRDLEGRAKLGFDENAFIMLACGESIRGANHNGTILTTTVLNLYDPKYKMLLWGRGALDASARRFSSLMLPRNFIRFATDELGRDVTFERLVRIADAMLVTADGPVPTLPIATAMAGGLPIVAVVSPTVAELLQDRHTALMFRECRSRLLAKRVLDVHDDPQLRWKLCDAAKAEAYEFFAGSRFVAEVNAIYDRIAGTPR